MIKINVISSNILWRKTLKNPQGYFDSKLSLINKKDKLFKKKKLICSLLLSDTKEIKKLNKKFRKKNKSTDVLSFPFYEKKELYKKIRIDQEVYIGDIIINLNQLYPKKPYSEFKRNLNVVFIHGLIHLFGYDHKRLKDFKDMHKLEKLYLKYLD